MHGFRQAWEHTRILLQRLPHSVCTRLQLPQVPVQGCPHGNSVWHFFVQRTLSTGMEQSVENWCPQGRVLVTGTLQDPHSSPQLEPQGCPHCKIFRQGSKQEKASGGMAQGTF